MNKHVFIKPVLAFLVMWAIGISGCSSAKEREQEKPNILILMSDNHSWNHVGCYGDPVVKTPNIDHLAQQGIRFTNAFCSAPSCTPARASMLTGQDIWRLEEGANLWGTLPSKFQVYTELLEKEGYLVGIQGKGWGPGNYEVGGWDHNPGGESYDSFNEFYNQREEGQPFSYWFSSRNPHRPYDVDANEEGIDKESIQVPGYLPESDSVRGDMADYYAEIQEFDREIGSFLQLLKETGEMENTLIIVCSDNGWQMPRGLANLYEFGTKIPLIITMPESFMGDRVVDDFVSLNDLAPTFLELAEIEVPQEMTAKSLVNILESDKNGIIEPDRDFMVTARERHAFVRQGGAGYGGRSIITNDFLYIRNFEPEQWPAGDPPLYGDVDAHMLHYPSPTKEYLLDNREKPEVNELFNLAFGKRPAEELYDLQKDPDQMSNLANDPDYQQTKEILAEKLYGYLNKTDDPRVVGGEMKWLGAEYFAEKDKRPTPSPRSQQKFGLQEEYNYVD
jgi:arylsulfatase A-like enzyme